MLIHLVVSNAIQAFNKQLYLSELVGDSSWAFDVPTRMLSFGNNCHWHSQILGTESYETNTWLWAWANTASNLPPSLIQASLQMKQLGVEQNIPELTQPHLPLSDDVNGHVLSTIASGVCDSDAYYRGPYDGGSAFLLIKDEKFPRSMEPPLARLPHTFPQAISAFSIPDHYLALTSYLDQHKIAYTNEGNKLIVKEGGKVVVTATFDDRKRLARLDAVLGGK